MIFQALLEKNDTGGYILDFNPIITTDRETGKEFIPLENKNSTFIIKCNKFKVLNYYTYGFKNKIINENLPN